MAHSAPLHEDTALHAAPLSGPRRVPARTPATDPYAAFADELDALRARTLARLGEEDAAYVKRLDRMSRGFEIAGRALIHFSPDPITFMAGVGALWVHKQVQTIEIGHSALHGAWDRIAGCEKFAAASFRWDTPVDEASWRHVHNGMHHGSTNVAAKDPDIHFGPVRLTEQTPYSLRNRIAVPFSLLVLFPNFLFVISTHVSGLNDVFGDNGLPGKLDVIADRSRGSVLGAWKKGLRKHVPFYLKEYLFYPALAGPLFAKVALGNFLAASMTNVYTAATIFCGHVGDDVESWPAGTRAASRGEWYAMQVEASNDFEVGPVLSLLCGGLERQIEHHLFPTLPPPRLRELAPEVRAICERHGVKYKTDTWGRTLKKVFSHIAALARDEGLAGAVRAAV